MSYKVLSPANFIKHWAIKKPNACFLKQPHGKQWRETNWQSAYQLVAKLASYLNNHYPSKTKIGLFANNSSDWFLADMAIMAAGHISVPIYPSANADTVEKILSHSETQLVFVGNLPQDFDASMFNNVKCIAIQNRRDGLDYWRDIIENETELEPFFQPSATDIATLVYTSGTTGMPKGVVVSYRSLSAALDLINSSLDISEKDTFFSYLPLAHIMERMAVETLSIYYGCQVSFVENLSTFAQNLRETQPTLFIAVPRIWVKIKQNLESKFGGAQRLEKLIRLPLIGPLLKRTIVKKLGLNHARYCLTGAAAISPEIIKWYDKLGIRILEGYGLSETLGISNLNLPDKRQIGSVGPCLENCEMMVAENGEILLKGPAQMDGYYKEPELSAQAVQDGWFRTGDLGEIDEQGFLRIKGRVKEIFKTSKGKYISPNPIEQRLENALNLDQICVFGSQLSQPSAVVVKSNWTSSDPAALAQERSEWIANAADILSSINESLEKHERIEKIVVSTEEWNTQNNLMTPTLKIRRQQIEDRFTPVIRQNKTQEAVFFND